MTVSRQKQFFRAGDQIDVDTINRAEESCAEDFRKSLDRRYFHSHYALDLDNMAHTSSAVRRSYTIDIDLEHRITGIEVQIASAVATSETWTVTIEAVAGTSFTTQTVTVAGSGDATQWCYVDTPVSIDIADDTTYKITLSCSAGTWTCNYGLINVHYVTDRHTAGGQSELSSALTPQDLKSGDTMTAANFNTQDSSLAAAVTAEAARCHAPMIQVVRFENAASFPVYLHSSGKTLKRMIFAGEWATTRAVRTYIYNEVPTALANNISSGGGTGVLTYTWVVNATPYSQSLDDPEDVNDAWSIDVFLSGSGTVTHYYVILVWV